MNSGPSTALRRVAAAALACAAIAGLASPRAVLADPPAGAKTGAVSVQADAVAEEGKRRYREGEYAIALGLFQRAFELDGRADRIYNMARCCEKLGRFEEAARLLQQYIDKTEDVAGREEAGVRRREMERLAAEARAEQARQAEQRAAAVALPAPATPAQLPPPAPVARPNAPSTAVPWGLVASGAVLTAVGGGLWLAAALSDDQLVDALAEQNQAGYVTGITESDAWSTAQRNGGLRTAGVVVGGVGVTAAAAGAVWLLWSRPPAAPSEGALVRQGHVRGKFLPQLVVSGPSAWGLRWQW